MPIFRFKSVKIYTGPFPALEGNNWWCIIEREGTGRRLEVITFQEIPLLLHRRTVRTGAPAMRRRSWSIWPICYFQPAGVVRHRWRRGGTCWGYMALLKKKCSFTWFSITITNLLCMWSYDSTKDENFFSFQKKTLGCEDSNSSHLKRGRRKVFEDGGGGLTIVPVAEFPNLKRVVNFIYEGQISFGS